MDRWKILKNSGRNLCLSYAASSGNEYVLLAQKWQQQADDSKDAKEQTWLYACAADLRRVNNNNDLISE